MAICTFLGHRDIYDKDIDKSLSKAVYDVAKGNDEIEFFICSYGHFYDLCLAAVLELKSRFPKKNICITKIILDRDKDIFTTQHLSYHFETPLFMIDKAIIPPIQFSENENYVISNHKKAVRWAIQHSTHIIGYYYPCLYDPNSRLYTYAKTIPGIKILDVTNFETEQYIKSRFDILSESELIVVTNRLAGKTRIYSGNMLGVTHNTIHMLERSASRKLRAIAEKRLGKLIKAENSPPLICGVFSLGKFEPELINRFRHAVTFLISKYGVTAFHVMVTGCNANYINALNGIAKTYKNIRITAVTNYPEIPLDSGQTIINKYSDQFDNVINIAPNSDIFRTKNLRTIRAIMNYSDFCICNLSASNLGKNIITHMPKASPIKVLDLGKDISNIADF